MVCIAFTQAHVASIDATEPEDPVIDGIRDYFDENGDVPSWFQELQIRQVTLARRFTPCRTAYFSQNV